jgi:L-lactate dehydrogenase complex protein LldG
MSSRDAILTALRRSAHPSAALPEPPATTAYADRERQFAETLASVGGTFVRLASIADFVAPNAKKIVSLVPGAGKSTIDLATLEHPHELEDADLAILPGEFGVAENAAVWVPGRLLGPHRAIFVIAQHLILVVPAGEIVDTMHQACERIRSDRSGFGVFLSGPSKTADIEQSLVLGAHGARTCAVVVVG